MRLKLKDIKPNPFKKSINGGKLIAEQVKKLEASVENLKLMGALPVVKRGKDYCLVYGHNRKQALENKFGKDYEIEVVLHDYDDEQLFRGMVVENLTQRSGEEKEEIANLVAVRDMLEKNPDWVIGAQIRAPIKANGRKNTSSVASEIGARTIADWLNKFGEAMSASKVTELLRINDNLDGELFDEMTKTHDQEADESGRRGGDVLNYSQASILAGIEDKKEQKELAKVLKKSTEQRVREQRKLVTKYKESDEEVKRQIRSGEQDLANIDALNLLNYKKLVKEQAIGTDEEIAKMKEFLKPLGLLEEIKEMCIKLSDKYGAFIEDFYTLIDDEKKLKDLQSWVNHTIKTLQRQPKQVIEVKNTKR